MSLDIDLFKYEYINIHSFNITHNLGAMAEAVGLYEPLWHPEKLSITKAKQLIKVLKEGIEKLESDPEEYTKLNAENSWGTYAQFVPWLKDLLKACEQNPNADIKVSI